MKRLAKTSLFGLPWLCCVAFLNSASAQETPDTGIRFIEAEAADSAASAVPTANEKAKIENAKDESPFLRVLRNEEMQPIALETSIVRYRPATFSPADPTKASGEVTVDLIGAIHVGDALYYEKLNKVFEEYDVVLYELVAPPGERPTRGRRSDNPLAMLQGLMTSGLGLESQLAKIDYAKANFIHADLSPDEIAEVMRKRGDNGFTVALGVVADMIRAQNLRAAEVENIKGNEDLPSTENDEGDVDSNDEEEVDLLSMFLDPDAPRKLKLVMAEQFADAQQVADGLGPTLNTLIVEDRNQAALKVLQKQMAAGKKKIAIFYGAAHMPDFEKRLIDEFDLKRQDVTWVTAWDLTKRGEGFALPDLFRELAPSLEDLE